MSTREKLIAKVRDGNSTTITFSEFTRCLKYLGYELDRTAGSHQIWVHEVRGLTLNIQPKGKMAKPYQIKQFREQW